MEVVVVLVLEWLGLEELTCGVFEEDEEAAEAAGGESPRVGTVGTCDCCSVIK